MKILALDGGGMRGYMTAIILAQLEDHLGKPCSEIFDMITGVSTGSIIAGALATGMPARRVKDLYQELGPVVFEKPRGFLRWLFSSRYPSDGLQKVLSDHFPNDMSEVKTKLMTYAVRMSGRTITPVFWKSWRDDKPQPLMWKAMMASGAAPAFFDTVQVNGDWHTDGGVAQVNPAMCGLAEALRLGAKIDEIKIFNIGTITPPSIPNPEGFRGLINVMYHGLNMSIDAGDNLTDYQCMQILGDRYVTCAPEGDDIAVDSQEWGEMAAKAYQVWGLYEQEILGLLSDPT